MYNLQKMNGSFKGLIAECMFKLTNKRVVITKFFNKSKYFIIFGKYLSPDQRKFLESNWHSIDALEVIFYNGGYRVILYEIKTQNAKYENIRKWPLKLTLNTYNIYSHAYNFGFEVKLVKVLIFPDWDFDIKIEDFKSGRFTIDGARKYDFGNTGD